MKRLAMGQGNGVLARILPAREDGVRASRVLGGPQLQGVAARPEEVRDQLLSVGIAPDAKVAIDRTGTGGFEGYTYANDFYPDNGRHEDSPLVLVGTYVQEGRGVVVERRHFARRLRAVQKVSRILAN